MCLGIPGKVIEIYNAGGVAMGKIDFGGVVKEVCLAFVPEITLGDYAIVHVGFAITQLDEASAQESLAILRQMGALEEEFGRKEFEQKEFEQREGQSKHALS
jgi:hydrogenase expression/formation protein HypC